MYYPCVTHFPCVSFPSYSRHALIGAVFSRLLHSTGLNPVLSFCLPLFFLSLLSFLAQKSSKYNCIRQKEEGKKKSNFTAHKTRFKSHSFTSVWFETSDAAISPAVSLTLADVLWKTRYLIPVCLNACVCQTILCSGFRCGGSEAVDLPVSCRGSCVKCIYLFFLFKSAPGVSLYSDWSPLRSARPLYLRRRTERPQLPIAL